jgi:hypothetical protein
LPITAPKKWRFFPFGRYAGTDRRIPRTLSAESYAELFRRAQPMDFGIGYRWRTHESNLLLSVKAARRRFAEPSTTHVGRRRAAAATTAAQAAGVIAAPPARSSRSAAGFFLAR